MKTYLLVLNLILVGANLANAATLAITKKDLGGSKVAIGYSASSTDCIPAGFALKCTLSSGSISPSSLLSSSAAFNLFPDYVFSNIDEYELGTGTPLAQSNGAGVLTDEAMSFSICMSAFLPHAVQTPSNADFNYDGFVNENDVLFMGNDWLTNFGAYSDLNGDMLVNIRDFALLSEGLATTPQREDFLVVLQLPQGLNSNNLIITADTLRGGAVAFNNPVDCTVLFVPEPASLLLLGLGGLMVRQKVKGKR